MCQVKKKCFILSLLLLLIEYAVVSSNEPKHGASFASSVWWFSAMVFLDGLIHLCHPVFCKVPPLPALTKLATFRNVHVVPQRCPLGAGRVQCKTKPTGDLSRWSKPFLDQRWQEHWAWFTLSFL